MYIELNGERLPIERIREEVMEENNDGVKQDISRITIYIKENSYASIGLATDLAIAFKDTNPTLYNEDGSVNTTVSSDFEFGKTTREIKEIEDGTSVFTLLQFKQEIQE